MILDKLLEKKDLMIYIDKKIEVLTNTRKSINQFEEKHRARINNRISGSIKELRKLKAIINNNDIKDMAKKLWKRAEENELHIPTE